MGVTLEELEQVKDKVKKWCKSRNQWSTVLKILVKKNNSPICPRDLKGTSIKDPATVLYDMALRNPDKKYYERNNFMLYGKDYKAKPVLILYKKVGIIPYYKIRDEYFDAIKNVINEYFK